jgi:hypothetical protein
MTRSIQEGDPALVGLYLVGTDMLGDTAELAGNHIGLAYRIKEFGLAVVNVAHDGNHWRPGHEIIKDHRFLWR